MSNEEKNPDQNTVPYLSAQANWRSNRGDVQSLMRRLKENERKENNGKFILLLRRLRTKEKYSQGKNIFLL